MEKCTAAVVERKRGANLSRYPLSFLDDCKKGRGAFVWSRSMPHPSESSISWSDSDERQRELARSYRNSGEMLAVTTRPRLLRLATRMGLDLAAAKDVVQQAFTALFDKRPPLRDVEAWLVRVVQRGASAWRRKERHRVSLLSGAALPEEAASPLETEHLLALQNALARLGERQRRLVVARYIEGHTPEEAARLAGYSPGSFKQTMTRVLRKLREELGQSSCRHQGG